MALYNFQPRFVPKIESGEKTHTIRAKRKRLTRVGETLHLYTGLRRKGAKKILTSICTRVEDIRMVIDCDGHAQVYINDVRLAPDEREALAIRDGFLGWRSMAEFWNGLYPFHGDIIHWRTPGVRR